MFSLPSQLMPSAAGQVETLSEGWMLLIIYPSSVHQTTCEQTGGNDETFNDSGINDYHVSWLVA